MPGTCREVFLGPALCSTAIRAPHHVQQGAVFPKTFGTFLSFQTLTWRIFIYKSLSPQLPLVFRRHHKYQIVSGAKSKTILRKPFVCTGYISSRQMNLIVSPWDVELSTNLCFSQGLNYIILLGNLKANVIWRQRNKKKNVVSCTVGHTRNGKGHRRIILGNGNTLSVDCLPGDTATVTHITTLALRASLRYWRCPVPFRFISFSLQIPLPQNAFLLSQSDIQSVCMHIWPGQGQELNLWFEYVLEIDIDMMWDSVFEEHLLEYFIPTEGWQVTFYFILFFILSQQMMVT